MSYNVIRLDVKDLELIVNDVEEVAAMFGEDVELKDKRFWINRNGEGVELRFRQEGDRYVLEHINSFGASSGNYQMIIEEMFKRYGGRILAERTWEDGERNTLKVGYER